MRMIRIATVTLAALALPVLLPASPAHAEVYPWCAHYSGGRGGGGNNCGFTSYEQCMTSVSGIGGYCDRNPLYHGYRAPARRYRHPHDTDGSR